MYATLADDYDRFVNWKSRLAYEMPFVERQISILLQKKSPPLHILDAACGTGMHAIALSQLGHKVSGADLIPEMVNKSRQNALAAGVEIDFRTAGFGQLAGVFGQDKFDLLLCLGNSLPHLIDLSALSATLQDFAACLRPNGRVLIQNRNFDAVMKKQERWMDPQVHTEGDSEWIFQRFYDFEPEGLIRFNIVTLKHSGNSPWISAVTSTMLRPQLQAELVEELSRAGFDEIQSFGSMEGEGFSELTSGNLILIAIKK